jgi:hypothetical protein
MPTLHSSRYAELETGWVADRRILLNDGAVSLPEQPPMVPSGGAGLSGEHAATGRAEWIGLPLALLGSVSGAAVWPASSLVVVHVLAAFAFGGAFLEFSWRAEFRHRVAWGPGGVAYRRGYREGLLTWVGLDVAQSGQGMSVFIRAVEAEVAGGMPVKPVKIDVEASGSVTPSSLRFWTHTQDELISALKVAQSGALAMRETDLRPVPPLPKAKRVTGPWVTWAGLTIVILVITILWSH